MDKELFFIELQSMLNCGIKIDFSVATLGDELIYVVRINTNNGMFYQGIDVKLENAMFDAIKQSREDSKKIGEKICQG